jgi:hypothetical protein
MKENSFGISIVKDSDLIKRQETTYSSLSSSCLFHFMKKRSHLLDVLRYGFRARYSEEHHPYGASMAIPMKCFCDIPLSMAKKHMINYGDYGIGISKMSAMEHHITPVIYSNDSSISLNSCRRNIDPLLEVINITDKSEKCDIILPYFKTYDSHKLTKAKKRKYIRYYDEREWRYVPINSKIYIFHNIPKYVLNRRLKELNEKMYLKNHPDIDIDTLTITYIIVEREEDRKWIINRIEELEWIKEKIKRMQIKPVDEKKKEKEIKEILISKILTKTQIWCDF